MVLTVDRVLCDVEEILDAARERASSVDEYDGVEVALAQLAGYVRGVRAASSAADDTEPEPEPEPQ